MKQLRAFFPLAAVLALCLALPACLSSQRLETAKPAGTVLSPKLSPFVYFEDGTTLFIGVDGRAAQYIKDDEKIFPLGVGLANQAKSSLTLSRESFVLETASGRRLPVVSIQEFNRDYTRSPTDLRLADTFLENLATRFRNYRYVERQIFPYRGSAATATNTFELGRLFWTHLYLYFPVPEGGLHGEEFNLLVDVNESPETFVVHFKLR